MTRPLSIVIFEIAFLAALGINVAGPLLIWPTLTASVAEQAHVGADAGGVINGVLIGGIALIALLGLLLWWLVARSGSSAARWVVIVLLGMSLAYSVTQMAQSGGASNGLGVLALLGILCTAVALASLFMADARAWFTQESEMVS